MLTAALNLALIVTIGSGLSEAHPVGNVATTAAGGKPYRSDTAGVEGGHGNTVV